MKLVLVEWIDSHSGNGWQRLSEIQGSAEPIRCRSVGWLVAESDECKTIVPHISGETNEGIAPYGCGDLAIPTKAIVKMTTLRGA